MASFNKEKKESEVMNNDKEEKSTYKEYENWKKVINNNKEEKSIDKSLEAGKERILLVSQKYTILS